MGYFCRECSSKYHAEKEKACNEINKKIDAGAKETELFIEYANEKHMLLEAGVVNSKRFLFLEEATDYLANILACDKVFDAGWTMSESGEWVNELTENADTNAQKHTKPTFWKRIFTKQPKTKKNS